MGVRIPDINAASRPISSHAGVERRGHETRPAAFRNEFSEINSRNCMEKLTVMSGNIFTQGELVKKRMDITELKKYKEMVSDFLREAIKYSHEFKKDSSFDARGRHRVYSIVKKVNERLDEMTRSLLSEQAENIKVIDSIDEVRGLLLDLIV